MVDHIDSYHHPELFATDEYAYSEINNVLGSLEAFVLTSVSDKALTNLDSLNITNGCPAAKWFAVRDVQDRTYFSAFTDSSGAPQFGATFTYAVVEHDIHAREMYHFDHSQDRSLGAMNRAYPVNADTRYM